MWTNNIQRATRAAEDTMEDLREENSLLRTKLAHLTQTLTQQATDDEQNTDREVMLSRVMEVDGSIGGLHSEIRYLNSHNKEIAEKLRQLQEITTTQQNEIMSLKSENLRLRMYNTEYSNSAARMNDILREKHAEIHRLELRIYEFIKDQEEERAKNEQERTDAIVQCSLLNDDLLNQQEQSSLELTERICDLENQLSSLTSDRNHWQRKAFSLQREVTRLQPEVLTRRSDAVTSQLMFENAELRHKLELLLDDHERKAYSRQNNKRQRVEETESSSQETWSSGMFCCTSN